MAYCVKCGGTGIDINGNACSCKFNVRSFFESVSCLDVPEQYRGIQFNRSLVPKDLPEYYAEYLQSIFDKVLAGQWQHNIVLASPIGHSKTILAYSCLEVMFRSGIETFPVFDVLELKRIMLDLDLAKKPLYKVDEPEKMFTVPLLFIKIPRLSNWEIYDTISVILDRRVRRGNHTIFLYDGDWKHLIYNDRNNILTGLVGDGAYNTVLVKSFWVDKPEQTEHEIIVEENKG